MFVSVCRRLFGVCGCLLGVCWVFVGVCWVFVGVCGQCNYAFSIKRQHKWVLVGVCRVTSMRSTVCTFHISHSGKVGCLWVLAYFTNTRFIM